MPLQITFHDVSPSDALEDAVRKEAAALEHYAHRITSCRVVIAVPHRHQHNRRLYSVRIDITVPEEEVIINREHHLSDAHEDPYLAVREAFHAARRELEDYVRRIRGQLKMHEVPANGSISKLEPREGWGLIAADDQGREIFFDQRVLGDVPMNFLLIGDRVHFAEAQNDRGPVATNVRLVHLLHRP
jgi:ribosome-associated translation inhibitor RaiA